MEQGAKKFTLFFLLEKGGEPNGPRREFNMFYLWANCSASSGSLKRVFTEEQALKFTIYGSGKVKIVDNRILEL